MPFTPISLPIQQVLMTNFVTDIATITNANTLLLQAKLEDLINDLEIDIANLSIGTDNPINYIKAQSVIIQDQSLIYQTGSPTPTIIASLTKNLSGESIFQADHIIANIDLSIDGGSVNTLLVNTASTFDGTAEFNAPITINSSVIESQESISSTFTFDPLSVLYPTTATTNITLTSTSRQNIFVTLPVTTAPTINAVYTGAAINAAITDFKIIIDFDLTTPPLPNTKFTIYIVDVVNSVAASIMSVLQLAALPFTIEGGTNLSIAAPIITHNNTSSIGLASTIALEQYGTNITFNYILDSATDDRLIVSSLVGASIF
jgi:hypothetical protein